MCSPPSSPATTTTRPSDREDVLHMCFDNDTLVAFASDGLTMRDVLDGNVPGYDADEIIAKAMEETGSYDGPWSPFEGLNP